MTKVSPLNSALIQTAVLIAVCLPYCINLGASSIWDANEAFYAETPREMIVSGNYLAPHFNFQPRAQKPPLTYWAILISYRVFGINEFAVRLPSALAAIGTVLFSYGMARMLFSPAAGLLAAIITAATPRVFILARRLPIDILLLFFLTGTLFFIIRAIQKNQRWDWVPVYVFAALGFLTKGPVAVVIPAGAYFLWALRRRLRVPRIQLLMGSGIFACIALPWYMQVYAAYGWTYISPFFLRDNLGRFATQTLGPSRGVLYYFSVFATDYFPWSFLLLLSLYLLWRRSKEAPLKSLSFGLPLFWCAFIFVLFSFSRNKQEYYIAPMYPVAAVILSGVLNRILALDERGRMTGDPDAWRLPSLQRPWIVVYIFLIVVLLCFSLALPYILSSFVPDLPPVLHYGPSLLLIAGFAWQLWGLLRRKQIQCFFALAIPIWIVYVLCAVLYLPALEQFRPVKSFCKIIEAQSSGEDEAGAFGTALPSMVYYLRRPIFEENSPELMLQRFRSDKQVFCILNRKDLGYFAGRGDLNLYVLDRHSHFAVRIGDLLNGGYPPGEELLLVSNKPYSKTKPGGSSPVS